MGCQAVKSAAIFCAPIRALRLARLRRGARLVFALALFVSSADVPQALATNKNDRPGVLFGGAIQVRKPPIRLDPVLPRGQMRVLRELPASSRLCSLKRPVCVERSSGAEGLALLTRAYEELTYGLALTPPRANFERPLTWFPSVDELSVRQLHLPGRGFDRASAFCLGGALNLGSARRCVIEAAVIGQSPATASWLRSGYAASLALELGDAPEIQQTRDQAFAHTEVGILTSTQHIEDRTTGASVSISPLRSFHFFDFLDRRSDAALGEVGFYALGLGATHSAPGAARYDAEPDLMDVLSATVNGDPAKLAHFFSDFAHYLFFQAATQRPQRGAWSKVVDWVVEGKTLPRSLILSRPLEPTGSAYVQLNLSAEQQQSVIAIQTSCEAPVSYVWSILRLDAEGNKLGSVPVGYLERGTSVEARVEPLAGTVHLVFVGTNMGGVDIAHPFDPDHEPHEAHGCRVYLSVLPAEQAP